MAKILFIAAKINTNIAHKKFKTIDKKPSKKDTPKIIKAAAKRINKIFNTISPHSNKSIFFRFIN